MWLPPEKPHRHPGRQRRVDAVDAVLEHQTGGGRNTELVRRIEEQVRRRLGVGDMFGGVDMRREGSHRPKRFSLWIQRLHAAGAGDRLGQAHGIDGLQRAGDRLQLRLEFCQRLFRACAGATRQ